MTAVAPTTTETNARETARLPRLLPGKRGEIGAAQADFFGSSKPGDPDLTFGEVLDVINPLQHIPLVSTLYRSVTGDTISPSARIVGGALYGGPIGAGVAMVGAIIEQAEGAPPETLAMRALGLESGGEATALASAGTGPGGLIAEATTAPAAAATTVAAKPAEATLASAASPAPAAAASGAPQLSTAAFDTLIRSMGGKPEAEAKLADAGAAVATETAAAGTTETRRFFPARQSGVKPTRVVAMDIRPEDKANYDNALRLMRQNIDRYTGAASVVPAAAAAAAP
ncbi:hypothetical protein [Zavarzinia aquatilis]|uniref:Uncharacterized protein n=1 Tax=Zavarzinia aquatilis TaxID=2211142 RepID=A0A317E2B2_9PROT|nr:hypothetical protein [Zavarzinia aquatilis]PWR21227.1 hypothetical protein DKG74_14585 [Zavarzinia aquatilis]